MRIKGQNVIGTMSKNGQILDEWTDIKSFEWGPLVDLQSEGYLGEDSHRKEENYTGASGSVTAHIESEDALNLSEDISKRARRAVIGTVFNFTSTYDFVGGGGRASVLFPDIKFSNYRMSAADRDSYVEVSFDFECQNHKEL